MYAPATVERVVPQAPPRPTKPAEGPFRFRLAEAGQSVPILTTVQDVAFDVRMMLAEHNRSKAAVTATRVHAVANSETARMTRRTTAGRAATASHTSSSPTRLRAEATIVATTARPRCGHRVPDDANRLPSRPLRRRTRRPTRPAATAQPILNDMFRPQHPVCSDLNNEAAGTRVEPPTYRLSVAAS